jgi:hypothetical protein
MTDGKLEDWKMPRGGSGLAEPQPSISPVFRSSAAYGAMFAGSRYILPG